ncbi:MAG: RCC1 domain-containing protein [Gemmatimonadales bacterium]
MLGLAVGACGVSDPAFDPPPVEAPFVAVDAGVLHTCALTTTNRVYCWGWNDDGQVGDGSRSNRRYPSRVAGSATYASVTAGGGHTCAVTTGGAPQCWGLNFTGQLGDGSTTRRTTPVVVSGGLTLTTLDAGGTYSCGLIVADSTAWCWGWGGTGQLGDGARSAAQPTPVAVLGGRKYTAVSGGTQHTCGLAADSTAWCWGDNGFGQLGNGTLADTTQPVLVSGGLKLIAITTGYFHTCALAPNGDAFCWGDNSTGQLGDTLVVGSSNTPRLVLGGQSFAAITAGAVHTCGITVGGAGYCWGSGASGQLGSQPAALCGTTAGLQECTRVPALISGGLSFVRISGGTRHSCGLTTGQLVYCWGLNNYGQLGDGSSRASVTPVRVGKQP